MRDFSKITFKQHIKYKQIKEQSDLLKQFQEFLEKYIHPTDVNISDMIHRKLGLGHKITDNDITMIKYSGALQFLILTIQETKTDDRILLDTIEFLINKLINNNLIDTFIEENKFLMNIKE